MSQRAGSTQEETIAAFADPKPGDCFTEMFCLHVFVLDVKEGEVTYLTASGPCELPRDGKLHIETLENFQKEFAYGTCPGYWVRLYRRKQKVAGWLRYWRQEAMKRLASAQVVPV